MKENILQAGKYKVKVYSMNTVIVGTGAAGFNAAARLYDYGQKDIAIVTEYIKGGTSRNTGSDKQTYYKLTLSGADPDSVAEMAKTLMDGQCVDGDIALCEAAMSSQCFMKLVELGVPFPHNRYGEYIGYKTDHDPRCRATSAGPYTSRIMTECLEREVNSKNIRIFDRLLVVKILVNKGEVRGLICFNLSNPSDDNEKFVLFNCKNLIYATGGPAGIYKDSAYPHGQWGSTGLALEAGVIGKNLTEWQYGIVSINPRWDVSGSYMQVLPKFISTDENGKERHEFLSDYFNDRGEMLTKVFLKGYQWPFDVRKIAEGSSIIDVLVYVETCKRRKVYLDYRENPGDEPINFSLLSNEANEYLGKAGVCFGTPYERLLRLNRPAVEFYRNKGVDLSHDPIEIAVCAQHNNGGLSIDCWWQTNVRGFFAAGEVSASHGVYRPGGSALNAGQVGSTRASQYIADKRTGFPVSMKEFSNIAVEELKTVANLSEHSIDARNENVHSILEQFTSRMSHYGAAIRNEKEIHISAEQIKNELETFADTARVSCPGDLHLAYRLRDVLICQYVYLQAMEDYIKHDGKSRGSALYTDSNGEITCPGLSDIFTFSLDYDHKNVIQEVIYKDGKCVFQWRPVRPIPDGENFFENVWRVYRENRCIY